jgi:hypothetical protein
MTCTDCNLEMQTADGCARPLVLMNDGLHVRLRWGDEKHWPRPKREERCGDCNVLPSRYHHRGCDIEECPQCNRQLITCDCWGDEEEDDDE